MALFATTSSFASFVVSKPSTSVGMISGRLRQILAWGGLRLVNSNQMRDTLRSHSIARYFNLGLPVEGNAVAEFFIKFRDHIVRV